MEKNHTDYDYSTEQGRLPMYITDILDICDPVLTFDRVVKESGIIECLKPEPVNWLGRPRYNRVRMLKAVLFGHMLEGRISLRELEARCRTDVRFMYLMGYDRPSYRAFDYFIKEELSESVLDIFTKLNEYIVEKYKVDISCLYVDGSKFEANANRYSYVWKKGVEKGRYKLYKRITALLEEMNGSLAGTGLKIETKPEYLPEELETAARTRASVSSCEGNRTICLYEELTSIHKERLETLASERASSL